MLRPSSCAWSSGEKNFFASHVLRSAASGRVVEGRAAAVQRPWVDARVGNYPISCRKLASVFLGTDFRSDDEGSRCVAAGWRSHFGTCLHAAIQSYRRSGSCSPEAALHPACVRQAHGIQRFAGCGAAPADRRRIRPDCDRRESPCHFELQAPRAFDKIALDPAISWTIDTLCLVIGSGDPYDYEVVGSWPLLPELDPPATQSSLF
ncbi:hypothetical protein FB548_0156 [Pseudoxanthomonas sp. 3HH-4]|nr:hypothetical protein FB548_0156 [Pseudoxanthomonas sp. 3HH-4]